MAVALVVVYHAGDKLREAGANGVDLVDTFNVAAQPIRMPMLVFLAGVVLPRSLRKSSQEFMSGKLRAIAYPYVVWTVIVVTLYEASSLVTGRSLIREGGWAHALAYPYFYLWFLAYLLVYYAASFLMTPPLRAALIPVCIIGAATADVDSEWRRFLFLSAYFFLGEIASRNRRFCEVMLRSRLAMATSVLVFAAFLVASGSGVAVRYDPLWFPAVVCCLMVSVAFTYKMCQIPAIRDISKFGSESVVFYVSHFPVILVVFNLLVVVGVSSAPLLFALPAAASVLLGFVLVRARWRFRVVDLLFNLRRQSLSPTRG